MLLHQHISILIVYAITIGSHITTLITLATVLLQQSCRLTNLAPHAQHHHHFQVARVLVLLQPLLTSTVTTHVPAHHQQFSNPIMHVWRVLQVAPTQEVPVYAPIVTITTSTQITHVHALQPQFYKLLAHVPPAQLQAHSDLAPAHAAPVPISTTL